MHGIEEDENFNILADKSLRQDFSDKFNPALEF